MLLSTFSVLIIAVNHSLISAPISTRIIRPKEIGQNHQADVDYLADRSSVDAVDGPGEYR